MSLFARRDETTNRPDRPEERTEAADTARREGTRRGPSTADLGISTTPGSWLLRGAMAGVLLCGALNAVSYFVRSDGWGNLTGSGSRLNPPRERLGFPLAMWEVGNSYGGFWVDTPRMLANIAFGCGAAAIGGMLVWSQRRRLNRFVAELESSLPPGRETRNLQFSIRGLLLWTIAAALLCAVIRSLFTHEATRELLARRELLGAIYWLGPWLLVSLALLPRRIAWQHRVGLIIPLTLGLIACAGFVGSLAGRPFDLVLLGIFITWTPQAMLAASGLTLGLLVTHHYSRRAAAPARTAADADSEN